MFSGLSVGPDVRVTDTPAPKRFHVGVAIHVVNVTVCRPHLLLAVASPQTGVRVHVLPYFPHGDLFNVVSVGAFDEYHGRALVRLLLSAVAECHKAGVCHRDVKPENVLLDCDFRPVLCDFGLSSCERPVASSADAGPRPRSSASAHVPYWRSSSVGSEGYFAPEVGLGLPYDGRKADTVCVYVCCACVCVLCMRMYMCVYVCMCMCM